MPHPEVSCVVSKEAHRAFAIGGKLAQLGPEPLGVQPVPAANSSQHRQRMSLLVVESWNRSGCMLPAPGAAPQLLASMFHCCLYCCPGSAAGRSGLGYGFYRDTYWAFVVLLHRLKPLPNSMALTQIGCARWCICHQVDMACAAGQGDDRSAHVGSAQVQTAFQVTVQVPSLRQYGRMQHGTRLVLPCAAGQHRPVSTGRDSSFR
jgi:hypothetical protein